MATGNGLFLIEDKKITVCGLAVFVYICFITHYPLSNSSGYYDDFCDMDPKSKDNGGCYSPSKVLAGKRGDASNVSCPAHPNTLIGVFHVDTNQDAHIKEIEKSLPETRLGGSWKPPSCVSREKLAVVIPYRARWQHLQLLLKYLHPMLQRQQRDYTIFIVEQAYNELFNKGLIMNIAFKYAMKQENFDCVIFHDVDMIPENDLNFYECGSLPRHLSPALDEMRYTLMYYNLVGGALALSSRQMWTVNGYSNLYWGWGAEDDDMYTRISSAGYQVNRPPFYIGRYKMIPHMKRKASSNRVELLSKSSRWPKEGLNSLHKLKYKVLNVTRHQLYTNITVDVGRKPAHLVTNQTLTFFQKLLNSFRLSLINP